MTSRGSASPEPRKEVCDDHLFFRADAHAANIHANLPDRAQPAVPGVAGQLCLAAA